jgi:hypothetical protein
MSRRVALARTYVSEESSASIIRVTRIGQLGRVLAVTSNWRTLVLQLIVTGNVVPSSPILVTHDAGDMFLRNVGSYKGHTA